MNKRHNARAQRRNRARAASAGHAGCPTASGGTQSRGNTANGFQGVSGATQSHTMPRARSDSPDAIDLGADGPAALVREVRTVTIAGEARGSVATVKTTVRRVACECTLDTLAAQHHLAHGGAAPDVAGLRYRAGLRFRGLWLASARRARVVADLTGAPARGSVQDGLAAGSDARDRVTAAIVALGMIRSAAVIAVCGEDESARGRLGALCQGLDVLVTFWELAGTKGVG